MQITKVEPMVLEAPVKEPWRIGTALYHAMHAMLEAMDIIQPDIARAGGFTEVRKIAALASAFDVPVAPHTGASSAVAVAASIQWAAALPNLLTFEHMYPPNPLREELLADPLPSPANGQIEVPQRPGLGIELSPQALARFRTS